MSAPAPAREAERPWREGPTYVPRQAEEPTPTDEAPTVPLQVVPEAKPGPRLRLDDPSAPYPGPARRVQPTPPDDSEPTQVLRALFERAPGASGPETATPPGPRPAVAGPSQETRPPSPPRRPEQPRQPVSSPEPVPVPPAPAEGTPVRPGGTVATSVLRAVPERAPLISATSGPAQMLPGQGAAPLGVVSAPTGVFGPPPVITAPAEPEPAPVWRAPETGPDEPKTLRPDFESDPGLSSASEWRPLPAPGTAPVAEAGEEEVKEPPVREFDVAESMLAPESGTERPGGAAGPVAESMARINTAVQQGRIEEATELAELAVTEALAGLGAEHLDVVRLRELTAYIAYLAGDGLRSFQLSLDLAGLRRRLGDPRGAYGNVQSAAAAWRAVRDPVQGLRLGHDLIAVWTELAAAEGPAADDLDQLERARSRMDRLAARARDAAGGTRPSPR
ncbi:hypothetical protein [Streptomyces nodosus]|uniref:hypothetical protein n=1 Tax=Streptomyces nodosus TaxID=40318 RepID=UPI00380ED086